MFFRGGSRARRLHSTHGASMVGVVGISVVKCGLLEQSLQQHLHQREKENIQEERF